MTVIIRVNQQFSDSWIKLGVRQLRVLECRNVYKDKFVLKKC